MRRHPRTLRGHGDTPPDVDLYDAEAIARRQERWTREAAEAAERAQNQRAHVKIGRNDPCPCGSGKKCKRCCLGVGNPADHC